MTVQHNRFTALVRTREFLHDLAGRNDDVGHRAASLLKHYPNRSELERLADACPALLSKQFIDRDQTP